MGVRRDPRAPQGIVSRYPHAVICRLVPLFGARYLAILAVVAALLHATHASSGQRWRVKILKQNGVVGLRLARLDGKIVIFDVVKGSPADNAGGGGQLSAGDVIVAVNGQVIPEGAQVKFVEQAFKKALHAVTLDVEKRSSRRGQSPRSSACRPQPP